MFRDESIGYVLNHVARVFARALAEVIAPYGVVPGQFAQLLALYEGDGITQQELCDIVEIEQPTMANTLARMERDGLIERIPHPADGRKKLILLTDHAHRIQAPLVAAARSVNTAATAGMDTSERDQVLTALKRLRDNLEVTR